MPNTKSRYILGIRSETAEAELKLAKITGEAGEIKIIEDYSWTAARQLSNSILTKIEALLNRAEITWSDLNAIIVFEGPGSFTGLRIGITVANTSAYTLNIPIIGTGSEKWFELGISQLRDLDFKDIVVPSYGAEANITKPK
ncbi:MAG: tRNA (adenosine(37)-N6)-threonylcarbamoyltransferase complex dimerization subunit type 1 TsaB [Candidatus Saccharimonadia bacterium]